MLRRLHHLTALLLLLWLGLAGAAPTDGPVALPALQARVTDLTGTLSNEQRRQLEAQLAAVEAQKGSQVVLLMLPTTGDESIEQFGIRLAEAWQPGRRGVDDGIILIVAKDDRRLRIEVGRGLEGALNDATAKRIVSEIIAPQFKLGNFYGGLQAGLAAIGSVIAGEALPAPPASTAAGAADAAEGDWVFWLLGAVLAASLAHTLLGLTGSAGVAGFAAFFAFNAFGLLIAILVGLLIFLISFMPLSTLLNIGMGGFSGRGSSGGFSGGGGDFGGGGASGSW